MTILATGRIKGVTLIELFLVIIIIGVLVGISLPSLKATFNNLRLDSFSRELQSLMNYLHERSIVEKKVIYLNIDNNKKEIWAEIKGEQAQTRLKTLGFGDDIKIETDSEEIIFYPDGEITKATIEVRNHYNQKISLTTKGVFGGVKILPQE
jgi:Tfp pilus assembly protein FimT